MLENMEETLRADEGYTQQIPFFRTFVSWDDKHWEQQLSRIGEKGEKVNRDMIVLNGYVWAAMGVENA